MPAQTAPQSDDRMENLIIALQKALQSDDPIEKLITAFQTASRQDDHIEKLIITLGQRTNQTNEILHTISETLQDIESHLRQIAVSSNPAPNYKRPLSDYQNFDWASIGATVLKEDSEGVTEVEWNDQVFKRRSGNNTFGAAIWFSRAVGKDLEGKNKYVRLITFNVPSESEPIAVKTKKAISQ